MLLCESKELVKMYCLKNVVKSSLASKELIKVLPLAAVASRGYSGHQIPDRLKSVSTDANPKFFDMVGTEKSINGGYPKNNQY